MGNVTRAREAAGGGSGGGTIGSANLIREQFPTLEASDFFRDAIDTEFVESTIGDSLTTTLANIDRSTDLAIATSEALEVANVGNFQAALQQVAPAAVGLQTSRDAAIASLLAGEIPAEVAQSTARQRAEVSALTGVGATSGFATQRLFRDFGINALDAIQAGIGFSTQALQQEQGLALNLTPRSEGIFGTQFGALQTATVPTAGQVFGISAQAEAANQKAEMFAAQQNLALDMDAFELAFGAEAADDLRRANRTNSLFNLAGSLAPLAYDFFRNRDTTTPQSFTLESSRTPSGEQPLPGTVPFTLESSRTPAQEEAVQNLGPGYIPFTGYEYYDSNGNLISTDPNYLNYPYADPEASGSTLWNPIGPQEGTGEDPFQYNEPFDPGPGNVAYYTPLGLPQNTEVEQP